MLCILFFNSIFPFRNSLCSPTKLLCFTRSSSLIHQLPAQYPSPVLDAQAASTFKHTLCDLVFPDLSKLVVCTLSSLLSQSSMQEMLNTFVLSDKPQVSFQAWKTLKCSLLYVISICCLCLTVYVQCTYMYLLVNLIVCINRYVY